MIDQFSDVKILAILKEYEICKEVDTVCDKFGIHKSTFYQLKKKFSGLDLNRLSKMRKLAQENTRLTKILRDLTADYSILKELVSKKDFGPAFKRS